VAVKIPKTFQLRHALSFARGRIPSQLVIQLTDACNASCPQCGMRRDTPFRRSLLSMDDCKRIIDHAAASCIAALSFTGGEPFLFSEQLLTLLHHAGDAGIPSIRTGTNGFLFMDHEKPDFTDRISRLAKSLADTLLYTFWISIDSPLAETHERVRGLPGVMKGIERALPIFHEHGIFPSANLGITKGILPKRPAAKEGLPATVEEFQAGFRAFFNRVIDIGFTIVNACYPMSLDPYTASSLEAVYGATAEDDCVMFANEEKRVMFRALGETIPEFRSRIRIFSPLSSLHALERQYSGEADYCRPCRGGSDFFFIDAKCGDTYPCGYRGKDNLGKFWDLDLGKTPYEPLCRECDWECFRDPSELLAPFSEFFSSPVRLIKRLFQDSTQTSLWLGDLRYYRAADFFHGRRAPDYRKLSHFDRMTNDPVSEKNCPVTQGPGLLV
jgi:MoaA/NifB/PqqE/SkfB family radical SAM enzyme